MYFAVMGKNPQISIAELALVQPKEVWYPKKGIVAFDTEYPELLRQLGGIIKSGRVVKEKDLKELLKETRIIGIQSESNGKHLKRTIGIKRYKLVDIFHTDKEIKDKGQEIINLENGLYGVVDHYQDIELYEAIDFGKPGRSMQMGMMPAKLTLMMLNIALSQNFENGKLEIEKLCIYDPFVGSGTTGFLANHLGYDFIGSDIKTAYAQQNAKRRNTTEFATSDKKFIIFDHDITEPLPLIREKTKEDFLIITEGWLGPIVKRSTSDQEIQRFQERVTDLYKSLLERIKELRATAVFTIPRYVGQENGIEPVLTRYAAKIGLKIQSIPEVYGREGQQVGRKIMIAK